MLCLSQGPAGLTTIVLTSSHPGGHDQKQSQTDSLIVNAIPRKSESENI